MKGLFKIIVCALVTAILGACSSGDDVVKGRFEHDCGMVDSHYGSYNMKYVMELDLSAPTIDSDEIAGGKCYGIMNFSNINRIYTYDIDSVVPLGNDRYLVRSLASYTMEYEFDTLTYNPRRKEVRIASMPDDVVFHKINETPFVGMWKNQDAFGTSEVFLSLYEPVKYPVDGSQCYGWIRRSGNNGTECYNKVAMVNLAEYGNADIEMELDGDDGTEFITTELIYDYSDGRLIFSMYDEVFFPTEGNAANAGASSAEGDNTLAYCYIAVVVLLLAAIIYVKLEEEYDTGFFLVSGLVLLLSILILWIGYDMIFNEIAPFMFSHSPDGDVWTWVIIIGFLLGSIAVFFIGISMMQKMLSHECRSLSLACAKCAVVFTVIAAFINHVYDNTLIDTLRADFMSCISFDSGFWVGCAAVCFTLAVSLFLIQIIILAVRLDGMYRWVALVIYPVVFAASVVMFALAAVYVVIAVVIAAIVGGFFEAARTYKAPEPELEPQPQQPEPQQVGPQCEEDPDRVVLDDGSVFGREIKRTWGNDFRDSDGNKWKKCSKDEYKLDN